MKNRKRERLLLFVKLCIWGNFIFSFFALRKTDNDFFAYIMMADAILALLAEVID